GGPGPMDGGPGGPGPMDGGPGGWGGDPAAGPGGEGMPPLGDMPPMGDPNAPPPGGPMGEPGGPMDPAGMPGGPGPMDGGPDLGAINQAMDMETTDPAPGPENGPGTMDDPAPDMPPPEDDGNLDM
ncbi:MAG: hypothetical protein CMN44_03150, partial [SAR116 cluster bacterium]|nr:hypothetical protein [SAR116 cluster bacterium]